jgi:ATP-dependent Lhr-like helicase
MEGFHTAVTAWFAKRLGEPTEPQRLAWPEIRAGRNTLIAAPTGSGKTLAAFLSAIDSLVRQAVADGGLPDATQVVYVSPLKALSNDVQRNLQQPLEGILAELRAQGLPAPEIRTLVRTGDTPASERAAMTKRPPHILVTTPESLYILLTSEGGRGLLRTARTLIVDEIHAVADDKRGSHLSLSVERLDALVEGKLVRIGLSATQRPIETVARFLVGTHGEDCAIVDTGHARRLDLAIELPRSPLEAVMAGEVWEELYDRLAELIREHRTTLVFVNTRRMVERVTRHLSDRLGEGAVAAHHGSLSKDQRFDAEQRLKAGALRALVATASLELGIDIGAVDLVCQLGSTRSIATLLQRVGRSRHDVRGTPKGRLFPLSLDELVEIAALVDAVRRGELERLAVPEAPLDILAQQMIAAVACEEWSEDGLFELVRGAYPYRALEREAFDAVLRMVSEGFSLRRGRKGAYLHRDEVHGRLRPRRGARLAALTSGGAIPDTADYQVVLEPAGTFLGTVNEDFAIESMAGDVFQLGNASWRIARVEAGRVLVEDAKGQPPTIPFWLGEAPGRSEELSHAVSRLRADVDARLGSGVENATAWLEEAGIGAVAAATVVEHLGTARLALGAMPTQDTLVLERFFDEAGDQHLVIHAPFGRRLNRAWGLAIRKRMCRAFNFELQAAATEDAIVLSLGPTHSFAPIDLFSFLHSTTVREVLVQALLDAPMFPIRWRWNASRALAIPRFRGGRRVPPPHQRMEAEDLVATVFPDQLACLENIVGDREVPDHPLVKQTIDDCLHEAMDVAGLEDLLRGVERGEKTLHARDLTQPSPLAREVLSAKPYAFLDDAPLEERRTQAVLSRRWLDADTAASLGTLDAAAIDRVVAEAWPEAETADELHDALVSLGFLTGNEAARFDASLFADLESQRRAGTLRLPAGVVLRVAVERLPQLLAMHRDAVLRPALAVPARLAARTWTREEALCEIVRARLETVGPTTAAEIAETIAVPEEDVDVALASLEGEGVALRGRFRPQAAGEEWCERRILARIHRATLERLRREIEPVSKADFLRFLFEWQRVGPDAQAKGAASLEAVLDQLEGFEAPASAWESEILPARIERYEPTWLDALCLSGRFVWGRARGADLDAARRTGPVRATPITFLKRESLAAWRRGAEPPQDDSLTAAARAVRDHLASSGASFFDEIVRGTGLLRAHVEEALGELVAHGLATSDSFTGLRALLTPSSRRPGRAEGRKRSLGIFGMENAGRWSLFPSTAVHDDDAVASIAAALLRRYGVVFRRLLEREGGAPPWRDLIRRYRRLESRGEVRGGRFVDGVTGEQYALPEAVTRLRALRKKALSGASLAITAADPLNLLGIVSPGERVATLAGNRVLYADGAPRAVLESGKVRMLVETDPRADWEARGLLIRRPASPLVRSYLRSRR